MKCDAAAPCLGEVVLCCSMEMGMKKWPPMIQVQVEGKIYPVAELEVPTSAAKRKTKYS